jgi:hypothetical protein
MDKKQVYVKKQKTATGHEIPVPRRSDFLRDLKRASTGADSARQPTKGKPKPSLRGEP